MPFLVSILLSLSIMGSAYAIRPYEEPIKLKGNRLVKSQDRVTNPPWPVKVVKVEKITKATERKKKRRR